MIRCSIAIKCVLLVFVVLLSGCAQNAVYHDRPWEDDNCISNTEAKDCTESYYQEHENFDLAFAEFSERGNAFNGEYIEEILERIKSHAKDDGVVLVVFVHGWKHNASEEDSNLKDFKISLQKISNPDTLKGRRLVGLYIGWRGASIKLPVLKELTFWDRKAAAEEVGKGGVTRLLLELERIDSDNDEKNVFVVIGHSFGGAIVVNALTEILTDRVVRRSKTRNHGKTLGDAVIVVNPAIEANQALHFVEAAIKEKFPQDQRPLFVSISTDGDYATHYAFPLGQTVGLLLTWRQTDLQRSYYRDRSQVDSPVLKEEHLDTTTVGNFAPFLTHRLTYSKNAGFQFQHCNRVRNRCVPKGLTTLSGQPTIEKPPSYPLFFIKTDESIMKNHNDIFTCRIHAFMLAIVDDVVRQERSASILADPTRLRLVSDKFLQRLADAEKSCLK